MPHGLVVLSFIGVCVGVYTLVMVIEAKAVRGISYFKWQLTVADSSNFMVGYPVVHPPCSDGLF
jgi:hypothetical protein